MITLNTLPTWVVGLVMLYTAYIWLVTIKQKVRMDSKAIAYTLILWGVVYGLSSFSPKADTDLLLVRVFMARAIIIMICLSQSLPLQVSYLRGKRRGGEL